MAFDENIKNEVLKHADIVKIIGSYLAISPKGKNFVAICPFHDDTDPSLTISPEKQIFKCFVCGTSGNAITFVEKYEHLNFFDAMRKVAELSNFHCEGLDKFKSNKPIDEKRASLVKCLHDLTLYYDYSLTTPEGKVGLEYFESRHLDSNIRQKYKLGFAPRDGKNTIAFLQQKGHSLKTIEDVGIASSNNGIYSDVNQGRAIFPLIDKDGDVIGYSARRLQDGPESKYVNSSNTYLFTKSKFLYNYNIAKEACRISNYLYVCEGFMDVYALSRIGIDSCVALMGTALTEDHVKMLRVLNVEIRLCLDGDLPGQTATKKAAAMLDKAGIKFSIVNTEGNLKDPDEILNDDGEEALRTYLNKLTNRVDFTLNYYLKSNPLKTNEEKRKLVEAFLPVLKRIKFQIELDTYVRKLAEITGYNVNSIRESLKTLTIETDNSIYEEDAHNVSFNPEKKALRKLEIAEREVLYQMLGNKSAVAFYEQNIGGFYTKTFRLVANYLVEYASTHDNIDISSVISDLELSDLKDKDLIINQLTAISLEKTHPQKCDAELLDGLLLTINCEKKRIFEEDTLKQSLEGKDPREQARIISDYNRRKNKK